MGRNRTVAVGWKADLPLSNPARLGHSPRHEPARR
jgi:hypothetical protein